VDLSIVNLSQLLLA